MPKIINETVLKQIIDLIDPLIGAASDSIKSNDKEYAFKSLNKNTNDLILVFPVLCTKGISIETASMISKAIEKRCVTLLQMLFSSVQIAGSIDGKNITDVQDYIRKFHSNIKFNNDFTVDDFINFTQTLESAVDIGLLKITDKDTYSLFKEQMEDIHNIAKVSLNEHSLADFECHRNLNSFNTILEDNNNPSIYNGKKMNDNKKDRNRDADNRFSEYLSSNDIKKANELMPTKVLINFTAEVDGSPVPVKNAIIGVKCKLYPIDSLEIINRISTKYRDTNWLQEFIRASTHEISFIRDFMFAIDRAKIDAISSTKRGSNTKMWRVLERRANKYKASVKRNKADCSPITTLVISQDELEYLKKDYDIDIEDRRIALKLMDGYNFMGLVIVDEPAESASFIWDEGQSANYETLSFRNLERESDDKNYRKVINLMTKISR